VLFDLLVHHRDTPVKQKRQGFTLVKQKQQRFNRAGRAGRGHGEKIFLGVLLWLGIEVNSGEWWTSKSKKQIKLCVLRVSVVNIDQDGY